LHDQIGGLRKGTREGFAAINRRIDQAVNRIKMYFPPSRFQRVEAPA
jgi:hypothetical protein